MPVQHCSLREQMSNFCTQNDEPSTQWPSSLQRLEQQSPSLSQGLPADEQLLAWAAELEGIVAAA